MTEQRAISTPASAASWTFVSLASLAWGVLTGVAFARPIWLSPAAAAFGCFALAWMNVVLIFAARDRTTRTLE